ncbi:MAG TPA: chromosomal replication initiator protein DnaA [Candidatus Acidoferrales bacterium]|nr:chromosomal replication initiator protein DnaA [Candidatus Acidoferrales bacterium]
MMETEWLAALPRLREEVGDRNFATWIEPIHCARDASGLRLEVPSRFYLEWLTRHFLDTIRRTLGDGNAVRVVVVDRGQTSAAVVEASPPSPPERRVRAHAPKVGRLVPNYLFETFVVGPSNQVAYQASRGVVDNPGRRFNPFFLWGGVGLGKTHLVNAIGHELLARRSRARVACVSAEAFMNNLITSLRQDHMNSFRDRFRDLDLLIIDDVQFIAGKERTQEEFFHTFETLYTSGRQMVLTSDKPPHAIADLEQRLRSRFEGGLIADVRPPTFEMRREIVVRKAAVHGVDINAEVATIIATRSGPSVRELEGALTRVLAMAALESVAITAAMVEQVLAPVVHQHLQISVDEIQACVAERFALSAEDLRSHRRDRTVNYPRQVAMYLSRTLAGASLAAIAERFGGRDHTTVMYAVRVLEDRKLSDPSTMSLIEEIEQRLRSIHGRAG